MHLRVADMGSPRRLTPEVHQCIIEQIDQGNYPEVAAQFAGIPRRTFERWLHDGREDLEDGEEQGSVAALARDVEKTRAQVVARKVRRVQDAGEKQWQADAWWLERNFPELYGRRFEAKVESKIDHHVTFSVESLPPERQRALAELALERLRADNSTSSTPALPPPSDTD